MAGVGIPDGALDDFARERHQRIPPRDADAGRGRGRGPVGHVGLLAIHPRKAGKGQRQGDAHPLAVTRGRMRATRAATPAASIGATTDSTGL